MTTPLRKTIVLVLALALGGAAAGCGYFNTLYNARRQFAEAERAAARGETASARAAYTDAIDKAAKSYRKYPQGRWSDDALYLIARSRFELGEYPAARAAAAELLASSRDAAMRADAHAILGASAHQMREPAVALAHLDSAALRPSDAMRGRVHLWRARVYRELGDFEHAWADLDAITEDDQSFTAAQLERITFGIERGDTAHTAAGFHALLQHRDARRVVDTVSDLALYAVTRFGAAATREMLAASLPDWVAPARDSIALVRAELAMRAGDTATANAELMQLAGRSATLVANAARVRVARPQLQQAEDLEDLRAVRAILLPALTNLEAQQLIRTMRLVEALVEKAQASGQPVALFAAGEIARDELSAPRLARSLFITFVDVAPQTPWAPKALLAAIALDPDDDAAHGLRERLLSYQGSPYVQATGGNVDADAYDVAEERLQRSLIAIRAEAGLLAQQSDLAVGRAVATLDSLRIAAQTDSLKTSCGLLIDTLAVVGTRADSVRSACMRSDTTAVAQYLTIDTMSWRPPLTARDSALARRRGNQRGTVRDSVIK